MWDSRTGNFRVDVELIIQISAGYTEGSVTMAAAATITQSTI